MTLRFASSKRSPDIWAYLLEPENSRSGAINMNLAHLFKALSQLFLKGLKYAKSKEDISERNRAPEASEQHRLGDQPPSSARESPPGESRPPGSRGASGEALSSQQRGEDLGSSGSGSSPRSMARMEKPEKIMCPHCNLTHLNRIPLWNPDAQSKGFWCIMCGCSFVRSECD